MSNVLIDRDKIDILANAISAKSGEELPLTLAEMVEAVDGIEGGGEPNLQAKTYTVDSAGTETITADSGYDGLSEVEVSVPQGEMYVGQTGEFVTVSGIRKWRAHPYAIIGDGDGSAGYIADNTSFGRDIDYNAIAKNTTITPSTSAQTIGGAKYMMEGAVTVNAMPTGTAGTPTATKGTVSNHSISVTPSVTNTTGYITGSTKTGTAVTVSASELVSGTYTVDSSGTKDVTNYASASVPSGSVGTVSIVTKKTNDKYNVTISHPNATTGYWEQEQINSLNYNTTKSLTLENKSVTPSTTQQVIEPTSREYYLDSVTVAAMPSGTAGTPTATKGSVSNHQVSITPSVTNTSGYITGSTKTGTAVTVSASELVSGSETKTANGTYDVTNLAELVVNVSGGGGSGLVYESGTYSPSADIARPTISFSNSHSTRPFAVVIAQTSGTVTSQNSNLFYAIFSWYDAYGTTLTYGSTTAYARNAFGYRTSSSATWNGYTQTALTGTATGAVEYNLTASAFYPYTGSSSRYWRKNNTYKWIAVWKPTT